jgi:signal transduction histidine kinase/CheY-like chemotaxis protein
MTHVADPNLENRVLILAPAGRDASLAADVLSEAGFQAAACATAANFLELAAAGAGAAVIAQEALTPGFRQGLVDLLAAQPPWSDLPIVIFTVRKASTSESRLAAAAWAELGNITALERPVHPTTLVSAVAAGLRARRRQYHTRGVLKEREHEVRERDKFLAMLGHELRNPLAAIMNAKQLMDRAAKNLTSVQRPLTIIDRQLRHLNQLVDDLLDVARITSGKITLKRSAVDLGALVRNVVDALTRNGREHGLDLKADTSGEPIFVMADPVRLEQVLGNIITNAIKYTPSGGHIEVTLTRNGPSAELKVTDSGVGISADVLPTVFNPFTQADRTLERAQGGMGLGLAVVRSLVHLHGGQVSAYSAGLGHGSEFSVSLPVGAAPAATPDSGLTRTLELPASTARHVLLVEDSADIRESLQELLETLGHRVDTAADGIEAVERATALRPEVALVDIGLPRLDGYQVAQKLRSVIGDEIYLIALTGYGQPEDRLRAEQAGFDLHLTKPLGLAELDAVLTRAGRRSASASSAGTANQVPAASGHLH